MKSLKVKSIISILFISFISTTLFAQKAIDEKNLFKTLEKNKDANAEFICEMNQSSLKISSDRNITLLSTEKSKIKILSGMDMTAIEERIKHSEKKLSVTFHVKDLASKTYEITKIDGIETLEQYKARIAKEQRKESLKKITSSPVQVITQEVINLEDTESTWLPGQIQDKLKSNLQEHLGLKTVVDAKSESAIRKLQMESESIAHDEKNVIEIGKITTAKFALFTKIRRTASGYTLNADFTDLTTGEQIASVSSKEYSKPEYLYGTTGAVDEITLAIGIKLEIEISSLSKNLLSMGASGFSVDDQIAIAMQNEKKFKKMIDEYDSEIAKLKSSSDINAIQEKIRIEAEKELFLEKQNAEKKRQEELKNQKERALADSKLEEERSIALKTQRDQLAKDAAEKAAEVRKMKLEQQGVLGQISILESKKKALVEIRQSVENRSKELWDQLHYDRKTDEIRIINRPLGTSEKDADGKQTSQSILRREKQIAKSYQDLTNKFFEDCQSVKESTMPQQQALLSEIKADQQSLKKLKTVSSMGEELKVSYGRFDGSKNGWDSYISLYSDGILIFSDTFIVKYEAVSGKPTPTEEQLLDFDIADEYDYNIDMYNSLLTRGDPIVYFEIDYNVTDLMNNRPSEYEFNFNQIRVINTITGETTQTSTLRKQLIRKMTPIIDINEKKGIVWAEKMLLDEFIFLTNTKTIEGAKRQIRILTPYVLTGKNVSEAYKVHENKLTQLYKDHENKLSQINEFKNKISQIEIQISKQKEIIQRKRNELSQLEKSYTAAESDSTKGIISDYFTGENNEYIRKRGSQEMKRLEPLIAQKNKEINEINKKIQELNGNITQINKTIQELNSNITQINKTISDMQK